MLSGSRAPPALKSKGMERRREFVMAGHSRPKGGVASLADVPAIHVLLYSDAVKTWMPGIKPGHDAGDDGRPSQNQ